MRKPITLRKTICALAFSAFSAAPAFAQPCHVVISQVYGGGGNTGAAYNRDFVELFNPTGSAVNLSGWTIQYASASGNTWNATGAQLSGIIQPGRYFLVQMTLTGANGAALPTPDFTVSAAVDMAQANGKVALVSNATALSGTCPTGGAIVDFVGFGSANCNEGGTNATAPSVTNAIFRSNAGCTDANVNGSDFAAAAASPRNSSTAANYCIPTQLVVTGISPASPAANTGFDVTVEARNANNVAQNVISNTGITLSTNGNAGAIGGVTTGTINAGASSVVISGVTLAAPGSGATITATRTSGQTCLSAGTSSAFTVTSGSNTSVAFGGSNITIGEDGGTANLTVDITTFSTTQSTSVDVVLTVGSGARVNNYTSQTVTFPANDGTSKTVTLTITDDMVCNGNETLTFELQNIYGGQGTPTIGTPGTRTVTITDDETPVAPTATAGTGLATDGFTANWNPVNGATGYFLDVFTVTNNYATDLFFSEYVEGSSSNKYLEIYNGTGAVVDLSDYQVRHYNNGSATPTYSATLSGTLAHGSTIVYRNNSAAVYLGSSFTLSNANVMVFNGDDALVLHKLSTASDVDIFGRIGEDPGTAWTGSGGRTTENATLVRNPAVTGGVTVNPGSGFPTLDTEWSVFGQDNVSNLGSHAFNGTSTSYVLSNFSVGNATSYTVTGLDPLTTYHYVVRSAGGCSTGGNSNQISVTTSAVPVYYSRSTGSVNDPIWSDTPTGAAGPAVWTNASEMVVQSGDAVTVDANTTIKSLTVQSGATLNIDANRFLKATMGANAIQGTLNAADNSEFQVTEGSSATLALGGTASFWDFRAGMTGGVTVTGTMEIRGTLQIDDGDFDCTGATVTLRSTATSTGRLGEMSAGASYTGNLNIERYIPAGATNWRLLGSPIQNRRVNHFIDDFYTAGFPGSHFPGFTVNGNPWPSIRWYDETDTGAGQNDGLQGVSSNTQLLPPGQGFAAWCGDNLQTTAAFVIDLGNNAPVVATTPVSLPVSWTGTGSPAVDGWNLVANPLPSPIAFDQIARGADVADYVTYYDPASGNTAVWDIDLAQGTNGGTNTIQSMQGFFLKANGPAVATTVSESAKVASNDGGFFGGSGGSAAPGLRLRISSSMNAFFDEALVVFHQGSPGLDADDAEKFVFADPTAPQIATLTVDDRALAINAHGGMETGFSIPVSVDAGVSGTYVISLQQLSDLGLTCITLEDLATGTVTPLPHGAQYAFEMEATDPNTQARFILHATAPLPLYVEDALCGADPNGQATVVVNGGPVDVTWTDDLGNALLTQTGVEGVAVFTGLDAGGYRVRVTGGACGELEQTFAINAPFVLEGIGDAYPASCSDAADGSVDLMILGGVAPYNVLWSDGSADPLLIAAPGSYTVTVTDANACSWTAAYIIASAGPDPAFTMESATVTVGTPVQFTSTLAEGSHYWSFGDGASSEEASPVHAWSLPGTYTVTHAVENGGCLESTSTEVTVELSTGVAGRTTAEARAWHDGAHVVVVHAFAGGEAVRIELIDATGRVALQRSVAAQTGRVLMDAAALAPGVWFVRLQQGSEQATLRVPVVR